MPKGQGLNKLKIATTDADMKNSLETLHKTTGERPTTIDQAKAQVIEINTILLRV